MTSRDFLYKLPSKISPEAIEGHETTFHFDLEGDNGGQYTVSVADGQVNVTDGLSGQPTCVVRAKEENFIKLIEGELNPMMAVLTGKVKISNQGEMLKFAKLFGLM
jgi:putative sterol carrier protein